MKIIHRLFNLSLTPFLLFSTPLGLGIRCTSKSVTETIFSQHHSNHSHNVSNITRESLNVILIQ